MRFSVTLVATDQSITVAEFAQAVEERGLDGLWLPDHTHMPVERVNAYPLGGELPERYKRTIDPLVGLAMAAAVTDRIRVGTGVMLPAQRDPIVTAKALATIDQQSGGRLAVGVGFGWNEAEVADHAVDPKTRRRRTREHVRAMQQLWERDVASLDGEFVRFAPSWSWPKPVQRPLPVLIGGAATPTVFEHVVDYAQGWIPLGGRGLADSITRLRRQCEDAGRDSASLQIVPFVGMGASREKVDAFERAGATEVAFEAPSAASTEVLTALDQVADLMQRQRNR